MRHKMSLAGRSEGLLSWAAPASRFPKGAFSSPRGSPPRPGPTLSVPCADSRARGCDSWAWRAGTLAAEAAAQSGDRDTATSLFASCIHDAHMAGALRPREHAQGRAARHALDVPSLPEAPGDRPPEP